MKYCTKCGSEVNEGAVVCLNCGCSLEKPQQKSGSSDVLKTLAKVFMIIGALAQAWAVLPLAWCIPMIIVYFKKTKNGEPVSTAFKVCTLIFVNIWAGVFMLCDKD